MHMYVWCTNVDMLVHMCDCACGEYIYMRVHVEGTGQTWDAIFWKCLAILSLHMELTDFASLVG